ncbi:YqiA/YcfP family alpha/beta fold hydrolase [Marichromatium bheemlicum]|uniref:Alpha/beta fold hydrolase n=1 Tax=Marichromatium bheemlicum TaxID=365339 RepID=A0ABX1I8J6_9GAMM|nr:YqiA/YcfP family alpha/beta fold hydrolase [Marichromatium bheemlicum]NKN33879.1 alpha/beta fold hydrolase [Marichromatium bheemlicum]
MLVYLHGLNSSSRSFKADFLRQRLAPHRVVAIDYPAHRPDAAVTRLAHFFSNLDHPAPAVVGSSMGGFYGQYLARRFRFSHLYLINPALTPWDFFDEYAGQTMTTATGERYQVTREQTEQTRRYGIDCPCDGVPTTVFLDRGDEVIDHRIAERRYGACGGNARVLAWDGGDHAFQHLEAAVTLIRAQLDASQSD